MKNNYTLLLLLFILNSVDRYHYYTCYGRGHGNPEKSTGPPSPASASKKLIITAIAASSLVPKLDNCCGDGVIISPSMFPESPGIKSIWIIKNLKVECS